MTAETKIQQLVRTFPTLARRTDTYQPWDAEHFARSWAPCSGGERAAALFVLSVWDPRVDWSEYGLRRETGTFDVHDALGVWDRAHREAFLDWAKDPWWA